MKQIFSSVKEIILKVKICLKSVDQNHYFQEQYLLQSHLLKHALTQNHQHNDLGNMKIIDSSFHNNKLKQKISEAYIKQYRPSLNSEEQSVELKLFN